MFATLFIETKPGTIKSLPLTLNDSASCMLDPTPTNAVKLTSLVKARLSVPMKKSESNCLKANL